ncbi:glucose inhibited division protein A [Hydrogenobaculum sp. Y04AAS1]|uniref:tRNA uridine-5-carboxymethylaminomethyl(34) synthesis enzyme MnmG n=1 Tax=Hydrogenobaculum sp. (strain Y04AAS1) TaxID=380749 RepID=UPI00015BCF98|nr:glucose inhibited division protein A [Hydrogenobaculum sp. Y04AAS1]HCT66484.1 tRNA uridine-5-carboxymethylaminomethyl(34) synthesis enzyme MnmG [Hydrogenobaculum sp.]
MKFDVVVVGAGHAGIEAAIAASKLCDSVGLFTINIDNIGQMSCNPAIGGIAKSIVVREIDILGGEMAKAIDATGIQFKMLNRRKGEAVWAPRAQADKLKYKEYMKKALMNIPNLYLVQDEVIDILVKDNEVIGVKTKLGIEYQCKAVVVTTGTFLNGKIFIGDKVFPGGRAWEPPSTTLDEFYKRFGFTLKRFKTGTPARLDKRTINFDELEPAPGDEPAPKFSLFSDPRGSYWFEPNKKQINCYITYTNPKTHEIIRKNLHRTALYGGLIKGVGPRYCPSIEDKVVKFESKAQHQIFLEPEGEDTIEIYPNGLSTSLPEDIQQEMYRTIKGLENVVLIRPAYAIEYDIVDPLELYPTLETKKINGLFHAGNFNGTTGYEEAAGQGILAGINAGLRANNKEPIILPRSISYIGLMAEDLATKEIVEPYRLFTSRSEYRLSVRQDNAPERLLELSHNLGLLNEEDYKLAKELLNGINYYVDYYKSQKTVINLGENPKPYTLSQIIAIEGIDKLKEFGFDVPQNPYIKDETEIILKYEYYIEKEKKLNEKLKMFEHIKLPPDMDYENVKGLTKEAIEKLKKLKPATIAQAKNIDGITPASISAILIHMGILG